MKISIHPPKDCDFYFKLYSEENKAKDAAQKAIVVAVGKIPLDTLKLMTHEN